VATRVRTILVTLGLVLTGVVGVATPASADTGGYPYASYYGPGTNPTGSYWTDSSGNDTSPYGYNYRNCTDYVAWKLQSLGVTDAKTRGLGNGGQWADNAQGRAGVSVSTTPSVNSVGVKVSTTSDPFGHVTFVEAVNSNGTLTVSEYNWVVNGTPDGAFHRRTATAASMGLTKFINFGVSSGGTGGTWNGVKNATFLEANHLVNGQQMHSNQYILSDDGRFVLLMQSDGNLVEYTASGSLWASNTAGHPGAYLGMQSDGNVVIYSSSGTVLWSTGPKGIHVLKIQTDGNLVARNSAGTAKWANNVVMDTLGLTYKGDDHLNNGQTLVKKQYLRSSDRRYTVVMHSDGRLNVYAPGWRQIWTSGSGGHADAYLGMQSDGNVVIYTSDGAVWATNPKDIQVLKIQDDGNLVARNSVGTAMWATGTDGKL
jgi:surface antigen